MDLKIAFCPGEHVAEAEVRHAIEQGAEAEGVGSSGGLLMKQAGINAGGEPGGDHAGVKAQIIGAASLH